MNETLVFRLLKENDKEVGLLRALRALRNGSDESSTHCVEQGTFRMIPGAPFAYWVSDAMRRKFKELPNLGALGAFVSRGASTMDDFRFVRLSWEVLERTVVMSRRETEAKPRWAPFAKGGDYAPYYFDTHLVVEWSDDGLQLKAFISDYRNNHGWGRNWTAAINGHSHYFRPGLTWPRRTQAGLSVRVLPAGCIFADKGPAVFSGEDSTVTALLAVLNSLPGRGLVHLQMAFGSYELGVLQRVPIPTLDSASATQLSCLATSIHGLKRSLDTATENSHAFVLPALLQRSAPTLAARLAQWNATVGNALTKIVAAQRDIDEACYRLYGISAADRATIEVELGTDVRGLPGEISSAQAAADLVSWLVGVVLGRFDVRLATGERPLPEVPDPFAALPRAAPGTVADGRPPAGYPIRIDADGILVDSEDHADDIVARAREGLRLLWGDQADDIEKEACALLGTRSLRDYFAKTGKGGFWDDHVRRYSKSRRRAPIYWLLQSSRGLYRVWIYAHRLTKDTLPKLLGARYLGGALAQVKHSIEELRPEGQRKVDLTKKQERRLAELDDLLVDLEEFAGLLRAAIGRANDHGTTVGYAPDLNDGVVLAAAPLHELIPWPKTRKQGGKTISELRSHWEELEQGEYDWSHVAMLYWPSRVKEKCRKDKSLALAHGMDAEFFPGVRDELRRQVETSPAADDANNEGELADDEHDEE